MELKWNGRKEELIASSSPTETHLTQQQKHRDLYDNDEDFASYATTHVVWAY